MIDQNPAHDSRRNGEEMCTVFPVRAPLFDQLDVGFIYERGRLKGVTRPFVPHVTPGYLPQFAMDGSEELVFDGAVSVLQPHKKSRDLSGTVLQRFGLHSIYKLSELTRPSQEEFADFFPFSGLSGYRRYAAKFHGTEIKRRANGRGPGSRGSFVKVRGRLEAS